MDIQGLMRQAQQMQQKMQSSQEELKKVLYEGSSGGGLVKATIAGDGIAKKIIIDDSLVITEDKDVLEDLIVAAFNDAKKKSDEASEISMKSLTKGMPMPAGFKL
ncbi:MAG: DNA-binding YbaB/EbfC family protein [Rickettsiales bacterium]|jgi:DNA-binding YbaB/EbfC family protein